MRRTFATRGTFNAPVRFSRQSIALLVLAVVGIWLVVSLVQEIGLYESLRGQAHSLERQNAALAAANQSYQRDIAAVSSGAAAEQEARLEGYSRPGERLYVIGEPPPPPAHPHLHRAPSRLSPAEVVWAIITAPFRR